MAIPNKKKEIYLSNLKANGKREMFTGYTMPLNLNSEAKYKADQILLASKLMRNRLIMMFNKSYRQLEQLKIDSIYTHIKNLLSPVEFDTLIQKLKTDRKTWIIKTFQSNKAKETDLLNEMNALSDEDLFKKTNYGILVFKLIRTSISEIEFDKLPNGYINYEDILKNIVTQKFIFPYQNNIIEVDCTKSDPKLLQISYCVGTAYKSIMEVTNKQSLNETVTNLDDTYKKHFKNRKLFGLPHITKDNSSSIYNSGSDVSTKSTDVFLKEFKFPGSKLKGFKTDSLIFRRKSHRPVEGKIKKIVLTRSNSGDYSIAFSTAKVRPIQLKLSKIDDSEKCAIDPGNNLSGITILDGNHNKVIIPSDIDILIKKVELDNKSIEHKIAELSCKISNKETFHKNLNQTTQSKTMKRLERTRTKLHETIQNKRNYVLHRLSTWLVDTFRFIIIEKTDVKELTSKSNKNKGGKKSNKSRRKNMLNSNNFKLREYLKYKAKKHPIETIVIEVPAEYTSKTCNFCNLVNLRLGLEKVWTCTCGKIHNRDENASKNIMRLGEYYLKNGLDKCISSNITMEVFYITNSNNKLTKRKQ